MMKFLTRPLTERKLAVAELVLIFAVPFIPLLLHHAYRINLFLAWEGAYRMANGEIPYRDFGSPVGYGFWLLPALFFKLFGPQVFVLVVVQVFINIASNYLFRGFLKIFGIATHIRLLALLVYCLSYTLFNFWPWYNHTVFVYELAGIYFLCSHITQPSRERGYWKVILSSFFIALSFLTKQDTGALALVLSVVILAADWITARKLKATVVFMAGYVFFLSLLIVPFLQYEFIYWFNMGQFPHNARVDKFDLIDEFLGASTWIKFYLLLMAVVLIRSATRLWNDRQGTRTEFILTVIVLFILLQASIIQVTSYTPIHGNIYFHSFAFAFLGHYAFSDRRLQSVGGLALLTVLVTMWWSGVFWNRFLKAPVERILVNKKDSDVVSKRSYIVNQGDTTTLERVNWITSSLPTLTRIRIPQQTEEGIKELMQLTELKSPGAAVLNMTELTFLAAEIKYRIEKGPDHPLWYHRNVAFFDREVEHFRQKVEAQEYDVILFQDIPNLNNFYPYEVRESILKNYVLKSRFLAPRTPDNSYVEVYIKK